MASAVRFDAVGDKYSRSASGLGASDFTFACWVKLASDRDAFGCLIGCDDAGGNYNTMGVNSTGTSLGCFTTTGDTFQTAGTFDLVVGTWIFAARVFSIATTDHVWRAAAGTSTLSEGAITIGGSTQLNNAWTIFIGNDGFASWVDGSIAQVKIWSAALTQAELEAELPVDGVVRTANLWAYYSFNAGPQTNDESSNGRTLTAAGTLTTDSSGPPVTPLTPPPTPMLWGVTRSNQRFH